MRITPKLKTQIESDIAACEAHTGRNGSEALYFELIARYTLLDSSFKNGLSTNGKAAVVGSEFDYCPELRAIASKLKMYLLLGEAADTAVSPLQQQVTKFVEQGELIGKEEYHPAENGYPFSYISGPKYDVWMSEINIFNERYLSNHPLHKSIHTAFFHRKTNRSAYRDMMGHLKALASDSVFWEKAKPKEETLGMDTKSRKSTTSYDVFISHANVDKIEYVDNLKRSLDKLHVKIFYDKDSLDWGDKWKDKILEGVKKAEFAIIVISENFFDREWTEKELNDFLNRQNESGQKTILPILHKITTKQLKEKYPAVADIQALNSAEHSCDEIALLFAGQLIKRLKE